MQANVKRTNLCDTIVKELESAIASMEPGDRLPSEKELSEQYEVGRSTIRESLKVLTARKIIVRRNEGTFVADKITDCLTDPLDVFINMEVGSIDSLLELREILEISIIRIAAQRATEEDLQKIYHAQWLLNEPNLSDEEGQNRDIQFHNAIAATLKNPVIVELLGAIRTVIARNVEDCGPRPSLDRAYHEEMVDSIATHDPDRAGTCMSEYFLAIRKTFQLGKDSGIK